MHLASVPSILHPARDHANITTAFLICALLWRARVLMRQRGGSPAALTVTHERQRDADGLAAISGEIAATLAQARRREKSAGRLRSGERFQASRTTPAAIARAVADRSRRAPHSTEASKMFTAKQCESGNDTGKWFAVATRPGGLTHRIGYCARGCPGHASSISALTHHLQFQLDRETDLWLQRPQADPCEICGVPTTLRARLGRGTRPYALCTSHQSSSSLQLLFRRGLELAGAQATGAAAAPLQP